MAALVKFSLTVALLLAVSAGSSAQPSPSSESCVPAKRSGPPQPAACFDATPHKKTCVTVDSGVQLQVLDWGGADRPDAMVLLPGYGDNAHVYDGFAYQFTDYFHVIGITRRDSFRQASRNQATTLTPGRMTTLRFSNNWGSARQFLWGTRLRVRS